MSRLLIGWNCSKMHGAEAPGTNQIHPQKNGRGWSLAPYFWCFHVLLPGSSSLPKASNERPLPPLSPLAPAAGRSLLMGRSGGRWRCPGEVGPAVPWRLVASPQLPPPPPRVWAAHVPGVGGSSRANAPRLLQGAASPFTRTVTQIQGEMALKCSLEKDPLRPSAAGSTFTPRLG